MHEISPGVERAIEVAKTWASRLGAPALRLNDLFLGLLEEDDGKPAVLMERLGHSVPTLRQAIAEMPSEEAPTAPPLTTLYTATRDWSIAHRADPVIMTDAFLLAVLQYDSGFEKRIARFGVQAIDVARLLTQNSVRDTSPPAELTSFVSPDQTEEIEAARIVDVCINRAREAARVLEDYCRFILNDRFLTEQLKVLRHELAEAATLLPQRLLLAARETLRDVGTEVGTKREYERHNTAQVATVNLKRLQESLRSFEEYGKLVGPDVGRIVESIRYRAYTLERALMLGSSARERLRDAKLYVLLTGSQCVASLDWVIERATAGGANVFQLREKALPDRELLHRALNVRRWTRKSNVLFIVNDRPDIAKLVQADGVHLGQDDMPVMEARRIVGSDAIIGVSTHTIEQLRQAITDGADYVGIGPTFPSKTKAFEEFPGLEFVKAASEETSLPAFVLGGVGQENVAQVVVAGGRRIAVGAAIATADDPEAVARTLRAALIG